MSRRINDCGDWVVLRAYTNYCVNAYLDRSRKAGVARAATASGVSESSGCKAGYSREVIEATMPRGRDEKENLREKNHAEPR